MFKTYNILNVSNSKKNYIKCWNLNFIYYTFNIKYYYKYKYLYMYIIPQLIINETVIWGNARVDSIELMIFHHMEQ